MRLLEVHIEVGDMDASVRLYKQLLDYQRVIHWDDGDAHAFILKDGSAFGLWRAGKLGIHNGQGGKHVHFAFQISPGEYDRFTKRIEDAGLTPLHHDWGDGHRSVYFFDYDGHQGEFMTKDWLQDSLSG